MKVFIFLCCLLLSSLLQGQFVEPTPLEEQQLEDLAELEDAASENDYVLQQLDAYRRHPLNLNAAAAELDEFPLLNSLQLARLLQYRQLLGDLISVYELQAVPGFSLETIRKMLPYITVASASQAIPALWHRFAGGSHQLLTRHALIPETARGYTSDSAAARQFPGSRSRLFFRYRYQFGNLLQYGFTGDKDAGEPLRFSAKNPGPDFRSFHVLARQVGIIKVLIVGDYTINMGQGLIHWQSQAFKKSAGVIQVNRSAETIRPYQSAGEYNFYRGAAATIVKRNVEASLFLSSRKLDANTGIDDSGHAVVRSILQSGLHRTASERADRHQLMLNTVGGVLKGKYRGLQLAANGVRYDYSTPLLRRDEPYNIFAVKGRAWSNYSIDYAYTYHNIHFFGELATDKRGSRAAVSGLMASLHPRLDLALLYRNIAKAYQSLYGNAFTESSLPSQEKGMYMGLSFRPVDQLTANLYADVFSFGWLKYRDNAPASGKQYLIQLTWTRGKSVELYARFRLRCNPLNLLDPGGHLPYPDAKIQQNWRTHVSIILNSRLTLRSRVETCWFSHLPETGIQAGHLFYTDLVYKPQGSWCSGSVRYQVFETDSYDTRLYAYENDVLFANSTTAFFGKGTRVYINLKGKLTSRSLGWEGNLGLRAATTLYGIKKPIGTGLDEINASHKSEWTLQLVFSPLAKQH